VGGGVLGAEGMAGDFTTDSHPETNIKRAQIAIAVTSIALSFRHHGTTLLGLSVQSLIDLIIESSGTLMMMIAFITFNSSLVPLSDGICSSNPCEFDFSGFRRNRTDDLGINSPSL